MTNLQVIPVILPTNSNLISFNFYIVQHEGKTFLIDAGINSDECWNLVQKKLKNINRSVRDLDAIILTHHHVDHIGLVNRIREVYDIPVFAHYKAFKRLKRDESYLQKRIAFFEELYLNMGCQHEVEKEIARLQKAAVQNKSQTVNGDFLPIEEGDIIFGLSVLEMPGHSVDHIALFHEESGTLFSSDIVIEHLSSNALIDFDENGIRTPALSQYEHSLKRILDLQVKKIYPGHGKIIHEPKLVIQQKLDRLKEKENIILSSITGRTTAAEIAKKVYQDKYEKLFPLVMSKVIGHLDQLVHLKKLKMIDDGTVIYYERNFGE